jgi:hypothetical protein
MGFPQIRQIPYDPSSTLEMAARTAAIRCVTRVSCSFRKSLPFAEASRAATLLFMGAPTLLQLSPCLQFRRAGFRRNAAS